MEQEQMRWLLQEGPNLLNLLNLNTLAKLTLSEGVFEWDKNFWIWREGYLPLTAVDKIWLGVKDVTLAREWSSLTIIDHPRCISRPRTASKRGLTIAATKNGQKRYHSWTRYHGRGLRAKSLGKSDLVHIVSGQLATISSRALLPQLIHLFTHCTGQNVLKQMHIGYFQYILAICPIKEDKIIFGTNMSHGWVVTT